jgi:hypothetical protein
MSNKPEKGDIVRIPQNVLLYHYEGEPKATVKEFYAVPKPLAAVYVDDVEVNGIPMKEVLVDNRTWYADESDIYKWRKNANTTD